MSPMGPRRLLAQRGLSARCLGPKFHHRMCETIACQCWCHVLVAGWIRRGARWRSLQEVVLDERGVSDDHPGGVAVQ